MKASRPEFSACFCRTASKRASRFRIDNLPVTVTFVPPQPEPSATRRFIRVLGLINVGPTRLLVLLQSCEAHFDVLQFQRPVRTLQDTLRRTRPDRSEEHTSD